MAETIRFRIRDVRGEVRAVHVRQDLDDGSKRMWWEQDDGTVGLGGRRVTDLPLFGSETVKDIPITDEIVIVEGEKSALALRAGGVPALATTCGAGAVPTERSLRPIALGSKFLLWPDNDDAGIGHMKALAQSLLSAGAISVRVINYGPRTDWPKGYDAADIVSDENAQLIMEILSDWAVKSRRNPKREPRERKSREFSITVAKQRDSGSVSEALYEVYGIEAQPGRSVRCPMHDDRAASLSVLRDDLRVICHAHCVWSGKGVTASEIRGTKA